VKWSEGHDGRSLGMYKARRAVVDQLLRVITYWFMIEIEPKLRRAICHELMKRLDVKCCFHLQRGNVKYKEILLVTFSHVNHETTLQ